MKNTKYVTAVLDIQGRFGKTDDIEANWFFAKLRSHGVKYFRHTPWAVWGEQYPWSHMFKKHPDGGYQIFEKAGDPKSGTNWNPLFWNNIRRLKRIAGHWRIAPYLDFGCHCSTNKKLRDKHPLYNNVDGIDGMYDTSYKAQIMWRRIIGQFVRTYGTKRIKCPTKFKGIKILGPAPWYGLGNELYCQKNQDHDFGRDWAYPKASLLRSLGYSKPILFSAHEYAAHAIRGYVSSEGDWLTEFKPKDTVRVFHGIDKWEDFTQFVYPENSSLKAGRGWAVSDDGTNCKDPFRQAICVNVDRYCSADVPSVISFMHSVKLYAETVGKKRSYFHHMEMLPRSVSETYQTLGNLNEKRDQKVYTAVSMDVFGEDISWKIPKWARKRWLE